MTHTRTHIEQIIFRNQKTKKKNNNNKMSAPERKMQQMKVFNCRLKLLRENIATISGSETVMKSK